MRSKEVEEVINRINISKACKLCGNTIMVNEEEIDTVLNYIEELEKENKILKNRQGVGKITELTGDNLDKALSKWYINKQVIRDKIEELERRCMLLLNNYEKCDTCEKESCSIRGKYLILKEILG